MQIASDSTSTSALTMSDLCCRSTLMASGISILIMFFQAFSGINAVMMYAVPILQSTAPTLNPIYCTILLQAIQVLFNLLASTITNRFGRRPPLIFSACGMSFSLCLFTVYTGLLSDQGLAFVPVLSCAMAVVAFAIGYGPLAWLVVAEIAPVQVSGFVSTLATATNWASNFILLRTFNDLLRSLGASAVFGIYSLLCFFALLFSVFLLPETANKTSQEILDILNGKTMQLKNIGDHQNKAILLKKMNSR